MRPSTHVKAVIDPEGAVLLDLRSGRYFAINEVAAHIWNGLTGGQSDVELVQSLTGEFEVDPDTASTHLAALLQMLEHEGLIEHDA